MEEIDAWPRLEQLWLEPDPEALACCFCGHLIKDSALIRTVRFVHAGTEVDSTKCSKSLPLPSGERMVVYDRHFECLLESQAKNGFKYFTISHVWDKEISHIQSKRGSISDTHKARRLATQIPQLIYLNLVRSGELDERDEIWHDYVCVPQWLEAEKDKILQELPRIYGSAHMTTVHFGDLHKGTIKTLYESESNDERIKSITDVCGLQWFSRVWTAMEIARSTKVISVDADYTVCPNKNDPLYLHHMGHLWDKVLLPQFRSVQQLEDRAGIGKKLVPWNLGRIAPQKGKATSFGMAFALLSRRGCRDEFDFLNALLGLVEPSLGRPVRKNDFNGDYRLIARLCIDAGDYSPLLMAPRFFGHIPRWTNILGYNDVNCWNLGPESHRPTYHTKLPFEDGNLESGNIQLKLQRIGVVKRVYNRSSYVIETEFAYEASLALQATGPDLDAFIDTIGCRLYGEHTQFIKDQLAKNNSEELVTTIIQSRYAQGFNQKWPRQGPHGAQALANALTLSSPQGSRSYSRIAFANAGAYSMHLGYVQRNHLLSILCSTCNKEYLFRAGLYLPSNDIMGATAYRIPGLGYGSCHKNGIALLLRDGCIVGRMMWATPACACSNLETVTFKMPELPKRDPRD